MQRLWIAEIFYSLQGESLATGLPTLFVRLAGCPLRCSYCDTPHALYEEEGRQKSIHEILHLAAYYRAEYVTVTGGEPLAQPECKALLSALCDQGYRVSLETSGALELSGVDPRVVVVMDIKTPGSGEVEKNLSENIGHLKSGDQVKFVICDEADYQWAKKELPKLGLAKGCEVLFLPAAGVMAPRELADWIVKDRLPVRFQIQLHKQLWGEQTGR